MRLEKIVMGSGAALGVLVLIAAVVADDFGEQPDFNDQGKLIAEAIGAGAGFGTPGLNAPQLPEGAPVGGMMQPAAIAPTPNTPGIPGLVPFVKPTQERFSGQVTQVMALGAETGWGQVHITIQDDVTGASRLVSLAPTWYLQYQGCTVTQNARVNGMAFRFDAPGTDVPLYARTIKVNGRPCQLRSDEGFALWSNRLGQRQ